MKSKLEEIEWLYQVAFLSPKDIALIVGCTIGTLRQTLSINKIRRDPEIYRFIKERPEFRVFAIRHGVEAVAECMDAEFIEYSKLRRLKSAERKRVLNSPELYDNRKHHILECLKIGITYKKVGEKYGVSRQRIFQIAN